MYEQAIKTTVIIVDYEQSTDPETEKCFAAKVSMSWVHILNCDVSAQHWTLTTTRTPIKIQTGGHIKSRFCKHTLLCSS